MVAMLLWLSVLAGSTVLPGICLSRGAVRPTLSEGPYAEAVEGTTLVLGGVVAGNAVHAAMHL